MRRCRLSAHHLRKVSSQAADQAERRLSALIAVEFGWSCCALDVPSAWLSPVTCRHRRARGLIEAELLRIASWPTSVGGVGSTGLPVVAARAVHLKYFGETGNVPDREPDSMLRDTNEALREIKAITKRLAQLRPT